MNNEIKIQPSKGNNKVEISNNFAQYFEQLAKKHADDAKESSLLAKDWANKLGSTVDDTEYSAKHYALKSKEEHDGAVTDIATAKTDLEQSIATGLEDYNTNAQAKSDSLQTQFNTSISDIKKQETTSINAVKTTQTTAESSITELKTSAELTISNGMADITANKEQSMSAIDENRETSLAEIESAKSSAVSSVNETKNNAVTTVKQTGDEEYNKIISTGIDAKANSDLSNLTTAGEKHFLNKSQITNCILEAPNGVATSSGNVVTVPTGVKALVNSGVTNADGTIKNVEVTTLEEQKINVSTTGIVYLGSDGTLNTTSGVPLVSVVYGTSSISAIYPYSPVELLKKSDKSMITNWSFPSNKNIDLTLGASGTTYIAPADGYVYFRTEFISDDWVSVTIDNKTGGYMVTGVDKKNGSIRLLLPVKKNDVFQIRYTSLGRQVIEKFIYAVGSEPST